jgi:hypothetical protein
LAVSQYPSQLGVLGLIRAKHTTKLGPDPSFLAHPMELARYTGRPSCIHYCTYEVRPFTFRGWDVCPSRCALCNQTAPSALRNPSVPTQVQISCSRFILHTPQCTFQRLALMTLLVRTVYPCPPPHPKATSPGFPKQQGWKINTRSSHRHIKLN